MANFLVIPNFHTRNASAENPPTIFIDNGESYSMEGFPRTDLLGILNSFDKRNVPREDQFRRLLSTSTVLMTTATLGNDSNAEDAKILEEYRGYINA